MAGFVGAINDRIPLPAGVELRSEAGLIICHQFTRARARPDWRDMELIFLAKIVKIEADIHAAQIELNAMGIIIENKCSNPIPNPLLSVIETLERRQLVVIRSMSLSQTAPLIHPLSMDRLRLRVRLGRPEGMLGLRG